MFKTIIPAILIGILTACNPSKDTLLTSPDGNITVRVHDSKGLATYLIHFHDTVLMDTSRLGIEMKGENFYSDLKLISVSDDKTIDETFSMKHGKRTHVHYVAKEKIFQFENANGKHMDVIFRVSNDGVAFRYAFTETATEVKTIEKEYTSFHFTPNATGFLQPMSVAKTGWQGVNPCYEEYFEKEIKVGTPSPSPAGWVYPAMFRDQNNWIVITETALDGTYCGTRLQANSPNGEYQIGFPEDVEKFTGGGVLPTSTLPWATPWRVLTIGKLNTVMESDLGVALAKPSVVTDTTFITPGHSSWSWALLKDDSTVFDVQKKFIDYASTMQWEYCLVDADWDKKIGYERIKELATYANTKNVGVWVWYNSAGEWNTTPYTPKSKLLTHADREKEFQVLHDAGVRGVKIDFFGGDGQSMIQYYLDILEDAAKYKLMVNFHGSTIPRGWHRTYPHLMSMEAVKGFEYVTFEQENADEQPSHCTILPFTRNLFDPMDFTPLSLYQVPRINRKTTSGFELALSIVFTSGVTHFVETPTGMKQAPVEVKEFLHTLPVQWHDVKFIAGYPGKEVVLARRYNNQWYIGAINGEDKPKDLTLDLSFLQGKKGYILSDSEGQEGIALEKQPLENLPATKTITVKPYGGFVLVTEP